MIRARRNHSDRSDFDRFVGALVPDDAVPLHDDLQAACLLGIGMAALLALVYWSWSAWKIVPDGIWIWDTGLWLHAAWLIVKPFSGLLCAVNCAAVLASGALLVTTQQRARIQIHTILLALLSVPMIGLLGLLPVLAIVALTFTIWLGLLVAALLLLLVLLSG